MGQMLESPLPQQVPHTTTTYHVLSHRALRIFRLKMPCPRALLVARGPHEAAIVEVTPLRPTAAADQRADLAELGVRTTSLQALPESYRASTQDDAQISYTAAG
jgi:hypothetical protein